MVLIFNCTYGVVRCFLSEKIIFTSKTSSSVSRSMSKEGFYLKSDSWDDYGHKVKFHLEYVSEAGEITRIGAVKIIQHVLSGNGKLDVSMATKLPTQFEALDDNYISLGQSDDYYKNFHQLFGRRKAVELLKLLNDIAISPSLGERYELSTAYRNALLRENGARRTQRFGCELAMGRKFKESLDFSYIGSIRGADATVEVDFNFDNDDPVPGRIIAIIGRNAVGKTRFLASLGEDLAQISKSSKSKLTKTESRFPTGRPLFTRIIAISYSAFDQFKRPAADSSVSYVYCGIRNNKGSLSRSSLNKAYLDNLSRIRDRHLEDEWMDYVKEVIGDVSDDIFNPAIDIDDDREYSSDEGYGLTRLSSGQSILTHLVTAILAWIRPNSIVLFDEPETHLHPNAVANLFIVLSNILKEYDSYAVVATHSPVVIQEIPAKRVVVFQREGNETYAEPLNLESFGESITEITKHVFETVEVDSVYRKTLKRLASRESLEEVASRFEHGLSLSAEAYLLSQYARKAERK